MTARYEPSAQSRSITKEFRDLFESFMQEGFTREESIQFVFFVMGSAITIDFED
jgi:hypothetical protein